MLDNTGLENLLIPFNVSCFLYYFVNPKSLLLLFSESVFIYIYSGCSLFFPSLLCFLYDNFFLCLKVSIWYFRNYESAANEFSQDWFTPTSFYFPSYLEDLFTGYIILAWQLFYFSVIKIWRCLLDSKVSIKKSALGLILLL